MAYTAYFSVLLLLLSLLPACVVGAITVACVASDVTIVGTGSYIYNCSSPLSIIVDIALVHPLDGEPTTVQIETLQSFAVVHVKKLSAQYDLVVVVSNPIERGIEAATAIQLSSVIGRLTVVVNASISWNANCSFINASSPPKGGYNLTFTRHGRFTLVGRSSASGLLAERTTAAPEQNQIYQRDLMFPVDLILHPQSMLNASFSTVPACALALSTASPCGLLHIAAASNATSVRLTATGASMHLHRASCVVLFQTDIRNVSISVSNSTVVARDGASLVRGGMNQLRGMSVRGVNAVMIGSNVTLSDLGFVVYLYIPGAAFTGLLNVSQVALTATASTIVVLVESAILLVVATGAIEVSLDTVTIALLSSTLTLRTQSACISVGVAGRRIDVDNVSSALGRSGGTSPQCVVVLSNASHWVQLNNTNGTNALTNVSWYFGGASRVSVIGASSGLSTDSAQGATVRHVSFVVQEASILELLGGGTWITAQAALNGAWQLVANINFTVSGEGSVCLSDMSTWLQVYGQKGSIVSEVSFLVEGRSYVGVTSGAMWLQYRVMQNGDSLLQHLRAVLRNGSTLYLNDGSYWVSSSTGSLRFITTSIESSAALHLRGKSSWIGATSTRPQSVVVSGTLATSDGAVVLIETGASILVVTAMGTTSAVFSMSMTMACSSTNITVGEGTESWWLRTALGDATSLVVSGSSNLSFTTTHITTRHASLTLLHGNSTVAVVVAGCGNRVSTLDKRTVPMRVEAWIYSWNGGVVSATAVDNSSCSTHGSASTSRSLSGEPLSMTTSGTAPGPTLEMSASVSYATFSSQPTVDASASSTMSGEASATPSVSRDQSLSHSSNRTHSLSSSAGIHASRSASTSGAWTASRPHASVTSTLSQQRPTPSASATATPTSACSASPSPQPSATIASESPTRTNSSVACGAIAPLCTMEPLGGYDLCATARSSSPSLHATSCYGLNPSIEAEGAGGHTSTSLPVQALLGTGPSAAALAMRLRCSSTGNDHHGNVTSSFLAHGPWGIDVAHLVPAGSAPPQGLWVHALKASFASDVALWTVVAWPGANRSWFTSLNIYRPPTVQLEFQMVCRDDAGRQLSTLVHVAVPVDPQPLSVATRVLTTATQGVQWASMVASPGSGSAIGRVAAVRRVMLCTSDGASDGGLLGLRIARPDGDGNDDVAGYARGALVGNVVVLLGGLSLLSVAAMGLGVMTRRPGAGAAKKGDDGHDKVRCTNMFLGGALRLVLPSTLFPVWLIVLPSTTGAVAYLTVVHSLPEPAVDLVCLVVAVVSLLVLPMALLIRLPHYVRSVWQLLPVQHRFIKHDASNTVRPWPLSVLAAAYTRSLWRHTKWCGRTDETTTTTVKHTADVVGGDGVDPTVVAHGARCARLVTLEYAALWFALLDALVLSTSGFLGGVSAEGTVLTCTGLAGGVLFLYAAEFVVCIAARPFTSQFSWVHTAFTLACSTASVSFQLLYVAGSPDGPLWAVEASAVCDLCVVGVTACRLLLVDVPDTVRGARKVYQASRHRNGHTVGTLPSTTYTGPVDGAQPMNLSDVAVDDGVEDGMQANSDADALAVAFPSSHSDYSSTPPSPSTPKKPLHAVGSQRVGLAGSTSSSLLFCPAKTSIGEDGFWDKSGRAVALQCDNSNQAHQATQQPVLYLFNGDDSNCFDDLLRRKL